MKVSSRAAKPQLCSVYFQRPPRSYLRPRHQLQSSLRATVLARTMPLLNLDVVPPITEADVGSLWVNRTLEITTFVALMVVVLLGVLIGRGYVFVPVASAVLVTMLLAWKTELARIYTALLPEEIRSAVLWANVQLRLR